MLAVLQRNLVHLAAARRQREAVPAMLQRRHQQTPARSATDRWSVSHHRGTRRDAACAIRCMPTRGRSRRVDGDRPRPHLIMTYESRMR